MVALLADRDRLAHGEQGQRDPVVAGIERWVAGSSSASAGKTRAEAAHGKRVCAGQSLETISDIAMKIMDF